MEQTDILVAGGGPAGLVAAARLASDGFGVVLADAAPSGAAADPRTTAFLGASIDTLRKAGVWEALGPRCEALWGMRILDAGGRENRSRHEAAFDSAELSEKPFGWNAANTDIRETALARLAALGVSIRAPAALTALTLAEDAAYARLADGSALKARLVVAADGRESFVRAQAGIGVRRWRYGQTTLVFQVSHPRPHGGVSTEIHRSGGPFTLVPMPDADALHRSSVVWMMRRAEAEALLAASPEDFAAALNERGLGVLGELVPLDAPRGFPIIGQVALRLSARRAALMAEAAHVIPPIGAQGLNMSLADLEDLATRLVAARASGGDIGAAGVLAGYHARRWPEMAARVAAVDALNRAAMAEARPLRDLRALALGAVARVGPVRRLAMRLGMGGA